METFFKAPFTSVVTITLSFFSPESVKTLRHKGTLKKSSKMHDDFFVVSGALKVQVGGSTRNALYRKTVKDAASTRCCQKALNTGSTVNENLDSFVLILFNKLFNTNVFALRYEIRIVKV